MTRNRNHVGLATLLASCCMLSACGNAGADGSTTSAAPTGITVVTTPTPTSTPTPSPTPTPTPTAAAAALTAPVAVATNYVPLAGNATLTIPDTVVAPGDTVANVHIRLTEPADRQLAWKYLTGNGSGANGAYEGGFFQRTTGTVTFRVGEQDKVVPIPIWNMNKVGQNFVLAVGWSQNNPAVGGATGTITVGAGRVELPTLPATAALPPADMTNGRSLKFSSDFLGQVNPQGGPGVWRTRFDWGRYQSGNGELAPYADATTDPGTNPHPIVDGHRVIRAEKVATNDGGRTFAYSASMLNTQGWYSFQYGYVQLRAKVTSESGVVPAFWLMPENHEWPPEIDIFEFFNGGTLTSTIHFKNNPKGSMEGMDTTFINDGAWHTYGLEWTPGWLITVVDGKEVHRRRNFFNQPMYIILNTAVGLLSSGPNASAGWHNDMALDKIEVWQ